MQCMRVADVAITETALKAALRGREWVFTLPRVPSKYWGTHIRTEALTLAL